MGEKLERTPNLEGASLAATTTCCKIVTGWTLCSNCPMQDMGEKLERTPNLEEASLAATTARCKIMTAWTLCNNCLTQDSGGLNSLRSLGLKLLGGVLWWNFYEILNSELLWIVLGIGALTRVKKRPLLKSISFTNKRKGL
jgi:hypothetical protein